MMIERQRGERCDDCHFRATPVRRISFRHLQAMALKNSLAFESSMLGTRMLH